MAGLNLVQVIGYLGRAPETRYTQNGESVTSLTVATTRKWANKQTGQLQEQTEWHRVSVWGKSGESVARFCKKGSLVYVQGRLETRQYEHGGETRYATQIVAQTVQFLDRAGEKQCE